MQRYCGENKKRVSSNQEEIVVHYRGYRITSQGWVIGRRGKPLKQKNRGRGSGYPCVRLETGWVGVHRLVCEAFHGSKPFTDAIVCHRDDNPLNNLPSNLYWGTHRTNAQDRGQKRKPVLPGWNGSS